MTAALVDELAKTATELGTPLFGTARVAAFAAYEGRRHPTYHLPHAQTVIVIGRPFSEAEEDLCLIGVDGRRSYSFANEILGNIAMQLVVVLLKAGQQAVLTPYNGVLAKDAAALANLGVIGKNSLLVTPEFGPRVRLRTIVTDAILEKPRAKPPSVCDDCPKLCWSACPAGAFSSGRYERSVCEQHSMKHTKMVGEKGRIHCRRCELACPVGQEQGQCL